MPFRCQEKARVRPRPNRRVPFDRQRHGRNLHLPPGLDGMSIISVRVHINGLHAHRFLVRISRVLPHSKHCSLTSCHSSFLQFVSDRASFDAQLESYVQTTYVQDKSVHYAL